MTNDTKLWMSDSGGAANRLEMQEISRSNLAQSGARQRARYSGETATPERPLGVPLSIHAVARMLGCSTWTVRQRHIPDGLPHFRSGPQGKLVFFEKQVVQWILNQQRRGGTS